MPRKQEQAIKDLTVMRHANPAVKRADMSDHDRPLDDRGRRDAACAASLLLEGGLLPELIISSSALRARETAELIREVCGGNGSLLALPELYLGHPDVWLEQLQASAELHDRVMLIGHNPGLEGLIEALTGKRVTLYTAAMARLRLELDRWTELRWNTRARLVQYWRP
jgi:phosphohistidine phosphatase